MKKVYRTLDCQQGTVFFTITKVYHQIDANILKIGAGGFERHPLCFPDP